MTSNVKVGETLRFLVLAAQREGQRSFASSLRPLGVTPTQAEALTVIEEFEPLLLKELGELLIAEQGSPSRLASALVAKRWVERTPTTDRRAAELRLTADGRRLVRGIRLAEQRLYAEIGAAVASQDVSAATDLLGAVIAGRPAGLALARRDARRTRHHPVD